MQNRWGVLVVSLLTLAACNGDEAEEAQQVLTTATSVITTTTASRSNTCDPPEAGRDDETTTTVFVYFYCEQPVFADGHPQPKHLFALPRRVRRTESVLQAALKELLKGTTVEEFNRGFQSFFFGADTAELLVKATSNDDGVAVIDFSDDFAEFGNLSTAFTATAIHLTVEATVRQFPSVTDTFYRLEGDRMAWCRLIEPIGVS